MPLASGTWIGTFEVLAFLGAGGMGEVYRARDTRLGRDVAIKVLPPSLAIDRDRLTRFDREARLLASLNHPHIAAIYGLVDAEGVSALVLELVDGPTLAERIARGPIPVREALELARQIADALEAAHAHEVIHRDLKPANVKVRPDGAVKVLDFGLAKSLAPSSSPALISQASTITNAGTRAGVVVGTPAYMSPEQARGEAPDRRTDIWAFGCLLYEMLTASRAFAGVTPSDTIAAVLDREPDWRTLPDATPPGIRRLLYRCLTKDPRHRLHHIADARLDLDEAVGTRAVRWDVPPAPVATSGSHLRRYRAHLAWATVAGVLTALLAASVLREEGVSREPTVVSMFVSPPRGTTFPRGSGAPWPSISPDGQQLAFVAITREGLQRLWVRRLDSTTVRQLDGTEGAIRPFWSPDSRSLAYFANGKLARVDVDTGAVRVLADAPYSGGLAGTWGDHVIVWNSVGGFKRVEANGGSSSFFFPNPDDGAPVAPSFLPDGRRFLYTLQAGRPEQSRICVASVESSGTTCVLDRHSTVRYAAPGYLLLVQDGTLVAQPFDPDRLRVSGQPLAVANEPVEIDQDYTPPPFSASSTGVLAYSASTSASLLAWLDRTGTPQGPPLKEGSRPALSPDGSRLVVQRRDRQRGDSDIWLIDLTRGVETRFTFDRSDDAWPAFSPDGERVVYVSTRAGAPGLYVKRTSGAGVEEALGIQGVNPDWSPDGRFLLYQRSSPKTGFDLWALELSGDGKPFPVAQTEHGEREGRFSPDGRWFAYDSTESGRREIWIQPFPPTGSRWQISTTGGVSPQWRRDGKELYYVAADGALSAVPVETGTRLEWGAPQALFPTMFAGGTYGIYAASRDGQRFLVPVPPAPEDVTPITVIVNWTAALRR